MHRTARRLKTLVIFVLLVLLLAAYFHPDATHELVGRVIATVGN